MNIPVKNYNSVKLVLILFLYFIIPFNLFAQVNVLQKSNLIVGDNYRIYPSTVNQTEVFIVKSPLDENVLFSSANTLNFIPFFISEGIYVTTNGGDSWRGSDTCTGEPIDFHGGDAGITIDKDGTFILTRKGGGAFEGLYSHFSTDSGLTWSSQNVITTDDLERATLTSDVTPGDQFYGRTYAVWVKSTNPRSVWTAYSDNGAQNWSTPLQINNPTQPSAGGDITMGLNGKVYATWAGVTNVSPRKEIFAGFAKSTDGGDSWIVTENAFDMNGITGVLENKANIRVNGAPSIAVDTSGGTHNGWIYIVTGQKNLAPAGSDPDIILYRSTDDGASWSDGIRVNQDALNNGKTQYFPAIHIDKFGGVNIIFYDDRNTTTDSSGVFLARSDDGGNNWNEFEISDHNFKPAPIGGLGQGYQGDNISLTSTSTKLWPVWMDNSTGIYQIWTVPINLSTVDVNDFKKNNNPISFSLLQNYPNPFNPSTTIEYNLQKNGFVSLKIYGVQGEVVSTLISEEQNSGNHRINFSISDSDLQISSGVYFYTLRFDGFAISKAMVILK